jgi:hypothetical protein
MAYLTVVPAYGRDYATAKAVKAAWEEGKDFQISNMFSPDDGRYVNKDDRPAGTTITVRFARLAKTVNIPPAKR